MIDGNLRVLGRCSAKTAGEKLPDKLIFMVDVICPDMLRRKILRSPLAHARIVNRDTSRARNLPGVKTVITTQDVSPADRKRPNDGTRAHDPREARVFTDMIFEVRVIGTISLGQVDTLV